MNSLDLARNKTALRITLRLVLALALLAGTWGLARRGVLKPATAIAASPPYMVKDINPASQANLGFDLSKITTFNGNLYFFASDGYPVSGGTGTELWISDGTPAGTTLLKDICPGFCSSGGGFEPFTASGGLLYFIALDGSSGTELWKTDGTTAGTTMLKHIHPGDQGGPGQLTDVAGTLFFVAHDGIGEGLWKSDGTEQGTILIKRLKGISWLTDVNGTLYFNADDGINGAELWRSDGTQGGTTIVKDICLGADCRGPSHLVSYQGRVYFNVNATFLDKELWVSDGTIPGTVQVKDIQPGVIGSDPMHLTAANGYIYFFADDGVHGRELWQSDGTTAGTVLLKDANPGSSISPESFSSPEATGSPRYPVIFNVNGIIFYTFRDGSHGVELWRSDGTSAGTMMVKDINPGYASSGIGEITFTNVGGTLFFAANDGTHGNELWKSDGSPAGTMMVKDINPGSDFSLPNYLNLAELNGILYFLACDGPSSCHFYHSDGTSAGTVVFKTLTLGVSSGIQNLTGVSGSLFFSADDGTNGRELWVSDGSAGGTQLVKDIQPGQTSSIFQSEFTALNGELLFTADDGQNGIELWVSDGTSTGTMMVKDIYTGSFGSGPEYLTNVNNTLYFVARDNSGYGLWKSDGTNVGTTLIKRFQYLQHLASVNGTLFFTAVDTTHGEELWKSDGTPAGTTIVKDIQPGSNDSSPERLTNVNGTLFFTVGGGWDELWKSDGTNAGTTLVKNFHQADLWSPDMMTGVSGTLFFTIGNDTYGNELWMSDGTAAGTIMVKDINPGIIGGSNPYGASSHPTALTNYNGTLFFTANDGSHGQELWKSDGTMSGTVMVRDIVPGPEGSAPQSLLKVLDVLMFSASNGVNGLELWRTEGTASTTTLVQDISPGAYSSSPGVLTQAGPHLFFEANNQTNGAELWALPIPADLKVTLQDSPDPVYLGDTLTYNLKVENIGFGMATGATLINTLPSEVVFSDVSPGSPTCTESGGTVTCNLGSLNPQEVKTVQVNVNPFTEGTLISNATVSGSGDDFSALNNHETESTKAGTPLSQLTLQGPSTGLIGATHVFTATASPSLATIPITYNWQPSGLTPIINTGGLSDTVSLSWDQPGVHQILVTASNDVSTITATTGFTLPVIYIPVIGHIDTLLFYFDDFSDPTSGWPIDDSNTARFGYVNDVYEVELKNPDWWAGVADTFGGLPDSYSVEAEMSAANTRPTAYGLIFGWMDWDHFYLFLVEPFSQVYSVWKLEGTSWTPLIDWQASSAILPDQGVNHLKAERSGSDIAVYINGQLLGIAIDNTFVGSLGAGIYTESFSQSGTVAQFDDFKIRRLSAGTSTTTYNLPANKPPFDYSTDQGSNHSH